MARCVNQFDGERCQFDVRVGREDCGRRVCFTRSGPHENPSYGTESPPDPVNSSGGLSRASDPPNAHEAEAMILPRTGTRKRAVLGYLQDRRGSWVDGYELATPEVGGGEGLRRLRELRAEGWNIEERSMPNSTAWQYRII